MGFHIANTLLLFLLLSRLTGALWRSALVAALFALHPLHVESVAWVSERKDVLSAFFFLLTLWAYVRYAEKSAASGPGPVASSQASETPAADNGLRAADHAKRLTPTHPVSILDPSSSIFYLLALGCFALGLMSKPMLVTLPFVLLLLDYWPLLRFEQTLNTQHSKLSSPSSGRKLPFFALAALSSAITLIVQRQGGAVSTSLSVGARIANALVSCVRYIGKLLWPENLSVLYPHPGHWPAWQVIASAALLLAVFAAVIPLARRRPYLAVGWLWFCGTLVPVIGLVQVGIQSMADRYTYVPLIGLFIMLVWGINDLIPERPWRGHCFGHWGRVGVGGLRAADRAPNLFLARQRGAFPARRPGDARQLSGLQQSRLLSVRPGKDGRGDGELLPGPEDQSRLRRRAQQPRLRPGGPEEIRGSHPALRGGVARPAQSRGAEQPGQCALGNRQD